MARRILILLILLLAGAVVNVGVAWGCAAWIDIADAIPPQIIFSRPRPEHFWMTERLDRAAAVRIFSQRGTNTGINVVMQAEHGLPAWSRLAVPSKNFEADRYENRAADARGWPMLSMCCVIDLTAFTYTARSQGNRSRGVVNGLLLQRRPDRNFALGARALPFRPIWPGFAVNTVFYATILGSMLYGLIALRRQLRRRRGRCAWCAYPMGESAVCTECGRALPGREATA